MSQTNTMQFVETGTKKVSKRVAKSYQVREAFKDMSFMGVLWAVIAYLYTTFELGILRTIVITGVVVFILNTLTPFWVDVAHDLLSSIF